MTTNQNRVRDHREPGHFWADNEIIDQYLPTIGIYGFAVYMLLTRFANHKTGQCDPSINAIAKTLGISQPTARKALDGLRDAGLIVITDRPRRIEGRKVNETNVYTLLAVPKQGGAKGDLVPNDIDQGYSTTLTRGTKGDLVGVLNQVESNNKDVKKERERGQETPASPARSPFVQAYFEVLPGHSLTGTQVQKINETVTDLKRWRKTLEEWALNGWDARRIGKILDRYQSGRTMQDERPATTNGVHHDPHERPPLPVLSPDRDLPDSQEAARKLAAMLKEQRHG